MKKLYPLLLILMCFTGRALAQVKNFTADGKQLTRFDDLGNAVDAHDGEIAFFNGTYYLYGTSYDCGFEWNNKTAPFCGFKTYSSKDMVNWRDEGALFDAKVPLWQSRCDGKTYGCFRPHVVYNSKNKNYVLWINVYDNVSGYRVFTSTKPTGPFTEVSEPKIAVNSNMPAAGLNNGDHDLFIDDDGKAYLAFTDWRAKGAIMIEQLTDDYLSGNGKLSTVVTASRTEAPGLFKRNGIYYVTYSDPNCGYCSGTGTSYKTAKSPLGPWSEGKKISDNSCGGQPSFVSTLKVNSDIIYLYGSDLWNNAAKNEALANYFWAPLTFAPDGTINPIDCAATFWVKKGKPNVDPAHTAQCGIDKNKQVSQLFTAKQTGKLQAFTFTTLKSGYPDAPLNFSFYKVSAGKKTLLSGVTIQPDAIGWSARNINVRPNFNAIKGQQYLVVIHSASSKGCYGFAKGIRKGTIADHSAISEDGGTTFQPEKDQTLKYSVQIK